MFHILENECKSKSLDVKDIFQLLKDKKEKLETKQARSFSIIIDMNGEK